MSLVTCGFCKDKHSVAGVQACAKAFYAAKAPKPVILVEPKVPAGRYALESDGVVKFYVVDAPDSGFWKGKTFLSVLASDEKHGIKAPATKIAILSRIAEDPKAAMIRYGLELKQCGRCGRTLTKEESRAAGIGPRCAELI